MISKNCLQLCLKRRVKPSGFSTPNKQIYHRWPPSPQKKCPKFRVQHHLAGNKETIEEIYKKCPSPKNILIFPSSSRWSWSGLWDAPYKMRRNDLQLPSTWRMQWFHVPSRPWSRWTLGHDHYLQIRINISRGLLLLWDLLGARGCKKRWWFFVNRDLKSTCPGGNVAILMVFRVISGVFLHLAFQFLEN